MSEPDSKPVAGDDDLSRVDLVDILRQLLGRMPVGSEPEGQQRARLTLVPVIGAEPQVGFKVGVGAIVEFPLGPFGGTRFSSVEGSLTISSEGQLGAALNPVLYGAGNAWKIEGQNIFRERKNDDVVLGTSSAANDLATIDYHSTRVVDTLYIRAWQRLYVGAGIVYTAQRNIAPTAGSGGSGSPSPFETYSATNGFDPTRQTSAGGSLAFVVDSRDNPNDALRGWYISAAFRRYFQGFLGDDSDWQELFSEARTYRALTANKRHKLAFWTFGDFVTSGTAPYLSLPTTAGDPEGRSDRGYPEGRFRGNGMLYGEVEYRGLVTNNGLLGVVSFVNVATMSNRETGEELFHSAAVGGGAGIRALFSKRSRANICLDVGFGRSGSNGVYLGLNDAF